MLLQIENLKKEGKIIGFVSSTFDLFHPGHIQLMITAKKNCDYLIVALQTDPTISRPDSKSKPIETTFERWIRLQACKYADIIIPYDTEEDCERMLKMIKPHKRFVGNEKKGTTHTGSNIDDIEIIYNDMITDYRSSNLKEKIK